MTFTLVASYGRILLYLFLGLLAEELATSVERPATVMGMEPNSSRKSWLSLVFITISLLMKPNTGIGG